MKMKIEESRIDNLIKAINKFFNEEIVVYVDIVSVEIKDNSYFTVMGKGLNAKNYFLAVREHLSNKNNSSLLLIEHKDDDFILFNEVLPSNKISQNDVNDFEIQNDARQYFKNNFLEEDCIQKEWKKWINMASKVLPTSKHVYFLHSNLTIPVSNDNIKIVSAIWLFTNKSVDYTIIDIFLKSAIFENINYTILPEKIRLLERQDTFNLVWHNSKYYLKAAKQQTDILEKKYRELNQNEDISSTLTPSKYLNYGIDILEMTKYLNNLDAYFFDENDKPRYHMEKVDILQEINNFVGFLKQNIINYESDMIRSDSEQSDILKQNIKDLFIIEANKDDYSIFTYGKVIRIIISDLLINATRFSYDQKTRNKPQVTISLKRNENNELVFKVKNEYPINESSRNIFFSRSFEIDRYRDFGLGIVIC